MNDQDAFENALEDLLKAGDWNGWLATRSIYADWLEERNHPLQFWARAGVQRRLIAERLFGDGKKSSGQVTGWHLWFEANEESSKAPGYWFLQKGQDNWQEGPAKLAFNYYRILGFPATSLRYTRRVLNCTETHKFTFKTGKPRVSTERLTKIAPDANTTERRKAGVYQSFDTSIHPLGYAALFLPHWYRMMPNETETPSLFDAALEKAGQS